MLNMGDSTPQPGDSGPRFRWVRRLLRFVVIALVAYVGLAAVLMCLENSLVYFPTAASEHWEAAPSPEIRDVTLASPAGDSLHAWWLPCPGSNGALLYLHGNAGNLSHRGPTLLELRDRLRLSVLIVDYPGDLTTINNIAQYHTLYFANATQQSKMTFADPASGYIVQVLQGTVT